MERAIPGSSNVSLATSCSKPVGDSAWAPSQRAMAGLWCRSTMTPSAPAAVAARVLGATSSGLPVA